MVHCPESSHLVLKLTNWEKARHRDVAASNQFRKGEVGSPRARPMSPTSSLACSQPDLNPKR